MFKNAIVLTGGIATGKSTVANLFKLHGFLCIDADAIAHTLLDENAATIAELFGSQYVENNRVLRKKLGELIFSNEEEKQKLESFIHPLIKKSIEKESELFEANNKPYLIDIPLFFEKRNYDIKESIVVYTPKEIQVKRLASRDKSSHEDALLRIENQMDIEEKKKLGNYIIDNSKDLGNLVAEVERVKNEILQVRC
ncbi:MAG TPA: dephospho-CoA kinase [Arcobacter sp.]|nr:dephospho-CoA kinase [Arcobacter sp.]